MKRKILGLILSVAILALYSLRTQALAEEASGVWQMQTTAEGKPLEHAFGQAFIIKKDGTNIKFYNLKNIIVAEGTISDRKIKARTIDQYGSYAIGAVLSGKEIEGTALLPNGQKVAWKAVKLGTLYMCGNHDPAHTAKTLEEMQELNKKEQCKGWSMVR